MHTKIILLITLISSLSALIFSFNSLPLIFGTTLFITFFSIATIVLNKFKFRLLIIWHVGFFYIIGFEGLLHSDELILNYGLGTVGASQYLVFTFLMSNVGYLILSVLKLKHNKTVNLKAENQNERMDIFIPSTFTYILIVVAYSVYLLINFEVTLIALMSGRVINNDVGNVGVLYSIVNSVCSTILPAILAFLFKYLRKSKHYIILSLLTSMPIILILFVQGTRYTILFSVAGLTLVLLGNVKIKMKNIILLVAVGILFLFLSEVMLESRGQGLVEYLDSEKEESTGEFIEMFYSREGVIKTNTWLIEYFDENPYKYGLSNSFILIFWIPRFIWPEKPTMLGHWLIREVQPSGYGAGHSVSYGFAGDAYVDFGLIGGAIFSLFLGAFLFFLDRTNNKVSKSEFNILFVAITIPFTFFAIRSFQTAFMNLVGMFLFLILFRMTLRIHTRFKENHQVAKKDLQIKID